MSDLFDDADIPSDTKQDRVIDNEPSFFIFPRPLLKIFGQQLGACGIAVYCAVRYYANYESKSAFLLTDTIAKLTGMGESTVRRELNKLDGLGIITKQLRKSKSSVYTVQDLRYVIAQVPLPNSSTCAIRERHNYISSNETSSKQHVEATPLLEGVETSKEDVIQRVWDYYCKTMNKPFSTLTKKRRKMGEDRFKEALAMNHGDRSNAIEFMEIAIDQLSKSDFHNGNNDRKKKYNTWEYAFRSPEQFEMWLNRSNGE